ncbi:MAG: FixH family protein [Roseiarcus sp.]
MMLLNSDQAMAQRGFPNRPDLSRPLTGRGVLIFLGLFFGSIFVANGALIYTALSTFHGEELANSYDASQEYNQRIADARAQEQLGWVADVTTRQEGRGERVVADFKDRDGEPISGLDVSARFVHPFDKDADRQAILSSDGGGGAYEGVASPLHSGRWTLVIEAKQDGQRKFRSENKITLAETAVGD